MPDQWDARVYRQRAEAWRQKAAVAPNGDQQASCTAIADGYDKLAGLLEIEEKRVDHEPRRSGPVEYRAIMASLANPEFDLTDMATVNVNSLVEELSSSDVLVAKFATGGSVLLKGEERLRRLAASSEPESFRCKCLKVANDLQRHMLVAALGLIEAGEMTPGAIETFGRLLCDAPDASMPEMPTR